MQIAKNTVVSLHYELFNADNQLLDKTEEPLSYLHGGYDGIFPLVEEALQGKAVGAVVDVKMTSDDAFGDREEELVRVEDLEAFLDDEVTEVTEGMAFEADDPDTGEVLVFRVIEVENGKVTVDANHPLAGMDLRFVANVVGVRAATADEVSHGHIHDEHGHHHHH